MSRVKSSLSIPVKVDIAGEEIKLLPIIGIAEYRVDDTSFSLISNTNWELENAKKNGGMYVLRATEPI